MQILKHLTLLVLLTGSTTALAWGPFDNDHHRYYGDAYNRGYADAFSDFMTDLMGDGEFSINIRAKARGKGKGRGHGYGYNDWRGHGYNAYNGYREYAPYPYYPAYDHVPPAYAYPHTGYRGQGTKAPVRQMTRPQPHAAPLPRQFDGPDPTDMQAWRERMQQHMRQRREQMHKHMEAMRRQMAQQTPESTANSATESSGTGQKPVETAVETDQPES